MKSLRATRRSRGEQKGIFLLALFLWTVDKTIEASPFGRNGIKMRLRPMPQPRAFLCHHVFGLAVFVYRLKVP